MFGESVTAYRYLFFSLFFLLSCGPKDQLFDIIASNGKSQVWVDGDLVHESTGELSDVKTYELDGDVLAVQWKPESGGQQQLSTYANGLWSQPYRSDHQLHVKYNLESIREESRGLYLIQFNTPVVPSMDRWLRRFGLRIHRYIPRNALVVSGSPDFEGLEQQAIVHRILSFKVDWKHSQNFKASDSKSYNFLLVPSSHSELSTLKRVVEYAGGDIYSYSGAGYLGAKLTGAAVKKLMKSPYLLWLEIDEDEIGLDMDVARDQGGADFLGRIRPEAPDSYTGIGIKGHVLEGIDPDHPDFAANRHRQAPISLGEDKSSAHGHKTFGIIFGSGEGSPEARGLLPNGQGFFTSYVKIHQSPVGNRDPGGRYDLTKELIEKYGIHFQTASWGHNQTLDYNVRSVEMDQIIYDLDIPILQSQSNSGNRYSRPEAWAKNVISVGGVYHFNTADPSDDRWNSGKFTRASTGPSKDGRIKPDLVGYMDTILTTGLNDSYTQFGGTSGATPLIAGHLGLVVEMWKKGAFPGNSRSKPHASLLKALLIHSADQYSFSGRASDLSRPRQGWGFPNLKKLYSNRGDMIVINETKPLGLNQTYSKDYWVSAVRPLKITMTYKDLPGVPSNSSARINDLDLKLTSPSGLVYWGNHGLREGMFSVPGGNGDDKDTVERILIDQAEKGRWKVEVIAREINLDANDQTFSKDAVFSLVVSSIQ